MIGFAYDVLNRPTAKTFAANPSANVAYAYDLAGRPTSALFANVGGTPGVTWAYDAAGRRITETTNGRSLGFAYDAAGNPRTMSWPAGGQITYAFDPANRLTSLAAGGVSVAPGYDGLSRMTSVARAASSSTVGFDNADRMASLAHVFTPTSGTQAWGFTFSPAGQLAAATTSNPAYDWTSSAATTVNTTADGLNRDAAIAAVGAPCAAANAGYDCNGNLTYDGTRRFTYDAENRLTGETGPVTMSLAYDPTGRLQQTIVNGATTQFLYDGDALVAEYDGSNTILRRYVHGPGVDNPVIWFEGAALTTANGAYLIADRQGSIVAVANTAGAVTANLTYDAYGVPNAWGGSRFRYTGQIELPEAALYYYKARVYDPASGRFLQTDPVGYKSDLDLYAYVANDPVDKADPTGLAFGLDDAAGLVLGAVVGVAVQGGEDLVTGQKATWGQIAGAAVSGAIIGVGAVNTPETGGLSDVAAAAVVGGIAGGAGDSTKQGVDIATGAQQGGFNGGDVARSAAVGAVVGGVTQGVLPKANIPGLSSGRGNMRSVAAGVRTRIANGNARNMSAKTAVKAAVGSQAANVNRTAAAAGVDAANAAACPSQGKTACR